jgi:ribosomal protein L11 methyltransferase
VRTGKLWQVSIATAPEAAEAVGEMLVTRFGQSASSFTDHERGLSTVSVFLSTRPQAWESEHLEAELRRIQACGLATAPGTIRLRPLRPQDWAETWKRHFKPLAFGSRLLVKPSWSRLRAKAGQLVVVLDPGLSFGTGQHPTTRFCLQQIIRRRQAASAQSLLDLGTGSGILAIAGARLGYAPVTAIDADAEAVRAARQNVRRNGVANRFALLRRDLASLPRRASQKYSVVCANLLSTLLIRESARIAAQVAPGGILVVAGILDCEFEEVFGAYSKEGFRLLSSQSERSWRSGCFRR